VWLFAFLVILALVGFPSAVNMADGMNGVVVSLFFVWAPASRILVHRLDCRDGKGDRDRRRGDVSVQSARAPVPWRLRRVRRGLRAWVC
jgi:hypothetical protein